MRASDDTREMQHTEMTMNVDTGVVWCTNEVAVGLFTYMSPSGDNAPWASETKVDDFQLLRLGFGCGCGIIRGDQEVGRFDVAVDDTMRVDVLECVELRQNSDYQV